MLLLSLHRRDAGQTCHMGCHYCRQTTGRVGPIAAAFHRQGMTLHLLPTHNPDLSTCGLCCLFTVSCEQAQQAVAASSQAGPEVGWHDVAASP